MPEDWRAKWDARHAEAETIGDPAPVLVGNPHLLPASGQALDLACGRGANALWLAARGLNVEAWDFSTVAVDRVHREAVARGLVVDALVRDVTAEPPTEGSFDLIVVSYFLDRDLMPALAAALRPGGRLFYQTFTREQGFGPGPSNPAFRLAPNELLRTFEDLRVRYYREDGPASGCRSAEATALPGEAMLVAERPV
jgi:SAM-dependent methyltransferase